ARVRQARSALLPNLSLTGSWVNRTFNPRTLGFQIPGLSLPSLVPPFNAYDGRARVTQTLFDASSMRRVGAARGQLNATNAERQASSAISAERLPRLDLEADYGFSGLRPPDATGTRQVAVEVTLPILDGFRREGRKGEQEAVVRESDVRVRDLRQQVTADVDGALL